MFKEHLFQHEKKSENIGVVNDLSFYTCVLVLNYTFDKHVTISLNSYIYNTTLISYISL